MGKDQELTLWQIPLYFHAVGKLKLLKERAKRLKGEIIAISLAVKDKRTPLIAKILVAATVSYALSPIDLIPDFIPVLGYLDDLILLPMLISISIKLIPEDVMNDCRKRANEGFGVNNRTGWFSAAMILLLWIGLISLFAFRVISK